MSQTIRVCFVCLGNICRSPTAEGVFRKQVADAGLGSRIEADSAGTGDWHVGESPDERTVAAAKRAGICLDHVARQIRRDDFARYDYLVVTDRANRRRLEAMAPSPARAAIRMLREFEPGAGPDAEVPDPYYGGEDGFDEVVRICERACRGLLDEIRRAKGL